MEHTVAKSSTLVFNPATLHFHRKSSHGLSRQVYSGLEDCCWLEIVALVAIDILSLFHFIRIFMSKSLL